MKKADFIIIGAVAAVVAVLLIFLYGINSGTGDYVQIEVDGELVEVLPLDEDATREIKTDNDGINILVIKDGKAAVTDANCPDGICAKHIPVNKSGESIICLPHKVVISVVSDKSDDSEIDAVA